MKILLIRPRPHKETIGLQSVMICEPLELEYISAYIGSDHEVQIIDMILEKRSVEYFIKKYQPDIVGMTAYIAHVNVVKEYAAVIKRVNSKIKTVVGGVHAEVVPEDFEDPHIDYVIRGNGLKTIKKVVEYIERNQDPMTLEGIWQQGKAPCIKEASFDYPMPDRKKVERYRSRYYYMFHNPCALIKTSFGCPYQCNFCFCRQITDHQYYTREIRQVIEELKQIPEQEIYIVDDDFLVDSKRILQFCDALEKEGLEKKFLIYGRADFIAENEAVIRRFADCGLRAVIVGLESCRSEDLQEYNKKSDVRTNEKAVEILHNAGVECYGTLILGIDWTGKDFENLYRWLRKLKLIFINIQPFTPLPGTPLYEQYKDQLVISRKEYEKWDLAHLAIRPTALSTRSYYWNIIKLYYKITMHPKNIWTLLRRYGIKENLKLSMGASRVTWQYFLKLWKG